MKSETPTLAGHAADESSSLPRRDFFRLSALAATGLAFARIPVMAGPFAADDWSSCVPADKKLDAEWVRSLFARGAPTTYRKSKGELDLVGMPIGGICCGTLYLGGDGRLWCWDIFNRNQTGILPRNVAWSEVGLSFANKAEIGPPDGASYVRPHRPEESPQIAQGFALRIASADQTIVRTLDARGWPEVTFTGQYPIGTVEYSDPGLPVSVRLEAYSPFIPVNADDSSLPVTVMEFTLTNRGAAPLEIELAGWLQNACSLYSAQPRSGGRLNRVHRHNGFTVVASSFQPAPPPDPSTQRPDLLIEDFEHGYRDWTVEGDAFGKEPALRSSIPAYQGDVGGEGSNVVNSHATAPGDSVGSKDAKIGRLRSRPFRIQRRFLAFYIGGGGKASEVGLRLWVDGQAVRSAVGGNDNRMRRESFEITTWEGREATIEIFDEARGGWGNVGVDHLVQTDHEIVDPPIERRHDFGTMALALLGDSSETRARPSVDPEAIPSGLFLDDPSASAGKSAPPDPLVALLSRRLTLAAGQKETVAFLVAWHFPNNPLAVADARSGNYYAKAFADAAAVASYVAGEFPRLSSITRLWRDTWYESTLPHWFLERTFANTSTLATTTCHRFGTGRFWAWEGVGCCNGTCTHVWHYAQAVGRLFPEIERDQRERVDFGIGFDGDHGFVRHRGEGSGPAIDGHCGRILGVWREHQMSADDAFLRRVWPRVRKAADYILNHDTDGDGILDGAQENTLDAAWYGQIAWISSLALAALRALEEMALELGENAFAAVCRKRFERGKSSIETRLFNGEYFIQLPEKGHELNLGTYQGCHIDQVHGQSWAWQVGLGRVLDREKTLSALKALWKYNFAPDVGPFRSRNTEGRPYALAGDAGLIMATNPKLLPDAFGGGGWQYGYFNECMTGFEHQAASHMVAEGLLLEGLAVTRAIHDRYHAARRNPWNEVECSDHYARAMASYGTFVTACGFEYHGPKGHLGFAPRLTPEDFKAAFTTAESWGSYSQNRDGNVFTAAVLVRHGKFRLNRLSLELPVGVDATTVQLTLNSVRIVATQSVEGQHLTIALAPETTLFAGQRLEIRIG